MESSTGSERPQVESNPYQEILSAIIKRFGRLAGMPAALNVARKVPKLSVDSSGNVLDFNANDPLGTITLLIDQYEVLYGDVARELVLQATQPLTVVTGEKFLQEVGLTESLPVPVRILLVDDHALFTEGLTRLINEQPDMKVFGTTGSMQEAVELILKVSPHLVIMDLSLSDTNGIEATRAILEVAPETKVIILTVSEDEERVFEAIRAGAIGYLVKSIRATELIKTLREVIRGEVGIHGATARRLLSEFARLSPDHPDDAIKLTTREIEVLRELANGASNQEIAKRLVISENTVKNHVRNVLVKLHLHSRRDAADYARRHGLTP